MFESGIRTHAQNSHNRYISALDNSARRIDGNLWFNVLQYNGIQIN